MTKRRATTLVLVLLMLALASALTLPLARVGLTRSFASHRAALAVRHRLAAESLLALLPSLTGKDSRILRDLDDDNCATIAVDLQGITIHAILQDDSAKLPIAAIARARPQDEVRQALEHMAVRTGLPHLQLRRGTFNTIGCFDDLFERADDNDLFGDHEGDPGWAGILTPLGHSVNIRRAEPATIAAMMWDADRGAADKLLRSLRSSQRKSVQQLITAAGFNGDAASRLEQHLSMETTRYSLLVTTTIQAESRRRYFICSADDPPALLVNWEVAP